MNLAEQAAAIFRQCTNYNMLTGEGFTARKPADLYDSIPERPYAQFQGPRAFLIMRKLDATHRVIRQRVGYDDGSSLLYTWDPRNGPEITTNDRKPDEHQPCTLGVGCDETGVCYAEAHGQPEQCGRKPEL